MKIFCVGRNYVDHAKELNNPLPKEPVIFSKPYTAILINGRPFYYPDFSKNIHFEAELVIRICKNGKKISKKFARTYYDQITVGLDLTARDIQNKLKEEGLPWEIAKGFDGSAVIGEWINLEELNNSEKIEFTLFKNDTLVQQGISNEMIFDFSSLITYISQYFTLQNGDYIFTGTPAGVGSLKIGDNFKGFIENRQLLKLNIK